MRPIIQVPYERRKETFAEDVSVDRESILIGVPYPPAMGNRRDLTLVHLRLPTVAKFW
jgi:hypothetical protein